MTPSERAELALFGQTRGFHTGSEERDLYAISKATLVRTIEAAEKDVLSGVAQRLPIPTPEQIEPILDDFLGVDCPHYEELRKRCAQRIVDLYAVTSTHRGYHDCTECGDGKRECTCGGPSANATEHSPGCQSGDFGPCDCALSSTDL